MSWPVAGGALIAIGTNVAWRGLAGEALVAAALARLGEQDMPVCVASRCRTTPAWPDPADPPFTNAAALVHAPAIDAQGMLSALLATEAAFGRARGHKNAPRTLDLDLIDFGGLVCDRPGLVLPHPRMHLRRFVLEPVAEIWPDWVHPVLGRTAADLLRDLD